MSTNGQLIELSITPDTVFAEVISYDALRHNLQGLTPSAEMVIETVEAGRIFFGADYYWLPVSALEIDSIEQLNGTCEEYRQAINQLLGAIDAICQSGDNWTAVAAKAVQNAHSLLDATESDRTTPPSGGPA